MSNSVKEIVKQKREELNVLNKEEEILKEKSLTFFVLEHLFCSLHSVFYEHCGVLGQLCMIKLLGISAISDFSTLTLCLSNFMLMSFP